MQQRKSLIFLYLQGSEEKVFKLLTEYSAYWQNTAAEGVTGIIINENGSKMQRHSWELMWHHVIDHSSWVGLNVAGHSMRIGGATTRHCEGMEILKIMRLGHWQDNTINNYLRPELCQPPEKLRKIEHFHTKRSEECHVLCNCPKKDVRKTDDLIKSKYQTALHKKRLEETSTTNKVSIIRSRMQKRNIDIKRLSTKIPQKVQQVKRIADSKFSALPFIKGDIIDSKLVEKEFSGHKLWFNVSVWVARKRWKRFQQTCKVTVTMQGVEARPKGNQGTLLFSRARKHAMWELMIREDKVEAKELIIDYDFYKKNLADMPPALSQEWKAIKPRKETAKCLLNHMTLRQEEIEAKTNYREGRVKEAMEIMRKLFYLPASTGGGVHYK